MLYPSHSTELRRLTFNPWANNRALPIASRICPSAGGERRLEKSKEALRNICPVSDLPHHGKRRHTAPVYCFFTHLVARFAAIARRQSCRCRSLPMGQRFQSLGTILARTAH